MGVQIGGPRRQSGAKVISATIQAHTRYDNSTRRLHELAGLHKSTDLHTKLQDKLSEWLLFHVRMLTLISTPFQKLTLFFHCGPWELRKKLQDKLSEWLLFHVRMLTLISTPFQKLTLFFHCGPWELRKKLQDKLSEWLCTCCDRNERAMKILMNPPDTTHLSTSPGAGAR
jgi:hypothetical protein